MADRSPAPASSPRAALAREAGALIAAHRRFDGRLLGRADGPARIAAEMADRAVVDRLSAAEALAACTRARSLEGALFQLLLAQIEADGLRGLACFRQAYEAEG